MMTIKKQYYQPYNNKVSYMQILVISLTILGFESFSFFSSGYSNLTSDLSIQYRAFYVFVVLFVMLKYLYKGFLGLNKSLVILIIFWSLYFIRGLYDSSMDSAVVQSRLSAFWLVGFLLCFLPIFALSTTINIRTINLAKQVVYILAIFVNLMSLNNNFGFLHQGTLTRLNANDILNSITYGQVGSILVIMAFSNLLDPKSKLKYLNIFFLILGLVNTAVAASRGPFLQLIFVFVFYFTVQFKRNKYSKGIILLLTLLIIGYYFSQYLYIFDSVFQRINSTNTDELRIELFENSWNRFISNPFIGNGAIGEYAHNIFLGSLEAFGILGGVLIILIYKNAIKEAISIVKNSSIDWIALLVIMQLIAALMSGAIWNGVLLWPLLGLISNIYYNKFLYEDDVYLKISRF